MPIIDVNVDTSKFNSDEDKVQFALGLMYVYEVHIFRNDYARVLGIPDSSIERQWSSVFKGIIAKDHASALVKFLEYYPELVEKHSLQVSLCE